MKFDIFCLSLRLIRSARNASRARPELLSTGRLYAATRRHAGDAGAFADALTGVYATDPQYGAKLRTMMVESQGFTSGLASIAPMLMASDRVQYGSAPATRRNPDRHRTASRRITARSTCTAPVQATGVR
ncbi:hypothetical protein PQR02_39630 [Paraburkholderia sediminicola]|uniref:Uncharacterized protein n=1 Tax=Paraburkholderia rhynchosiae TaxID=487049 RepID=A0ACC7NQZ4_9BURK